MRENSGSGLLHVMANILFIMLFGCLALQAQCRPQLRQPNSLITSTNAAAAANLTSSDDETKITLIFCVNKTFTCPIGDPCVCCVIEVPEKCYYTEEECKAKCPICYPSCPSPPGAMVGDQLLHSPPNTTM
ncbi:hypothetical protein ACP4OV_009486 [Aristida adscensionis]